MYILTKLSICNTIPACSIFGRGPQADILQGCERTCHGLVWCWYDVLGCPALPQMPNMPSCSMQFFFYTKNSSYQQIRRMCGILLHACCRPIRGPQHSPDYSASSSNSPPVLSLRPL